MKQLLLMLVLLIGSFTNAQNFDFSCGPTAEQIAAMELRILTDERIQLLADESSETTIISSEWSPEDGHVITIANSLKTILASDYGHRNFGKSESFDLLIEAVRKVVSRLDHIQTLASGDVKITHVYAFIQEGYDEFLMTAGTIGYNQDGNTDFGDSDYVIENLEGTELTDLYDKISGVVSRVQDEYDNPPLTLREMRINHILGLATGNVIIFNDISYQGYDRFTIHYEGAIEDENGIFQDQERIASNEGGHNVALDLLDPVEDFYSQISQSIVNVQAKYDARIIKRADFVMQIEDKSTSTTTVTVEVLDGDDIVRFTCSTCTTNSNLTVLSKLLVDSEQSDIDDIILGISGTIVSLGQPTTGDDASEELYAWINYTSGTLDFSIAGAIGEGEKVKSLFTTLLYKVTNSGTTIEHVFTGFVADTAQGQQQVKIIVSPTPNSIDSVYAVGPIGKWYDTLTAPELKALFLEIAQKAYDEL